MTTTADSQPVRLNRFLAQVGLASRRGCDDIIASGKVRVNGKRVRVPGVKVVPGIDRIQVDGMVIDTPSRPIVLLLNKPAGVVSTVSDPQGRPTVIALCRQYRRNRRLFPVGRLDVNTTGALLITNDGLLCYRLTHPRFGTRRTYDVRVRGRFDAKVLERLRAAATGTRQIAERGRGSVSSVELVRELGKVTVLRITLHEGRNRQVRRMCERIGLHVVKLKRIKFGPISVRGLPLGAVRPLEKSEMERLNRLTGMVL
ncbi:MAG: rRNA pseudouridine synthase [Candidatus Krumholzibacteriota bacterium]|nr:rRNA pseudouridine synthase [Candidatus Krumholzibacteriota bacterium]